MDIPTLNEDWIKLGSWDLPTDFDGFVWAIGAANLDHDGQVQALRHFMTLPAWTIAPIDLEKRVQSFAGYPVFNASDVRAKLLRYSEDQPRDPDGKFASGGGGYTATVDHSSGEPQLTVTNGAGEKIAERSGTDLQNSTHVVVHEPNPDTDVHGALVTAHKSEVDANDRVDRATADTTVTHIETNPVGAEHDVSQTVPTWDHVEAVPIEHTGFDTIPTKDWQSGDFHGLGQTVDNPIKTDNVDLAAAALGSGLFVQMSQAEGVGVLLNKLADVANDAAAKGEKAPDYNLCQVQIPDSNIFCVDNKGIPRAEMPQLKGVPLPGSEADKLPKDKNGDVDLTAGFLQHLQDQGFKVESDTVAVDKLHSTQNELVGTKVGGIMRAMESGTITEQAPYIVSQDNYLLDGHHRWGAQVGQQYDSNDPSKTIEAPVSRINTDIGTLVAQARDYAAKMGLPVKAATAEARRRWGARVRATAAAITNASDVRRQRLLAALRDWDESAHPRDEKGEFAPAANKDLEGGGQLTPIKGGGGTGAGGKPLLGVATSASVSTLPKAPDKNGVSLADRSKATLDKYVGVSEKDLADHVYQLFGRAVEDDKNGVPWENRTGKDKTDDTRTAMNAGTPWYFEAHDYASGKPPDGDQKYADNYAKVGFTTAQAAAGIAAMSPQQKWETNLAGWKALTDAYAHPEHQLTQAEADKLNTYHSGSLGVYVHPNTDPLVLWDKTKTDPATGKKWGDPAKNDAAWLPALNADGSAFKFEAGWKVGDIMAGKHDPAQLPDTIKEAMVPVKDADGKVVKDDKGKVVKESGLVDNPGEKPPEGAAGAVTLVGMNQSVSAGGSGYGNIEKAIQIANGGTIDTILAGAKVRSFFNNINAPEIGVDPVVDSHMIEGMVMGHPPTEENTAKARGLGDNMTQIMGSPSVAGASVGCYPYLADAIRDATERINQEMVGQGPGTPKASLSPSQVQAIVWLQQIHEHPKGISRS